ncbi:MAG: transcription-repair coupling factor [Chloroflexi bacterium]|nr:transcription-repair coupling factor [Chloroflexota bacterium]
MNLAALLAYLRNSADHTELMARLRAGGPPVRLNLLGAARAAVLAALHADWGRPVVVLAAKPEHALDLMRQLACWAGDPKLMMLFPAPDALPFERAAIAPEARNQRLAVLRALQSGHAPLIVAPARALMQQTVSPERFRAGAQALRRDETHPLGPLLAGWQHAGYEPVTVVEERGQFAHRGGIVDIWSPADAAPARIEFFGDEIDSIRRFDLQSQRSREALEALQIIPASEALPQYGPDAYRRLRRLVENASLHDAAQRDFATDLEELSAARRFRQVEFYLPYLDERPYTLLDHLPDGTLIVADEWALVQAVASEWRAEVEQLRADALGRRDVPEGFAAAVSDLFTTLHPALDLTFGLVDDGFGHWEERFNTAPRYGGKLLNAIAHWQERLAQGERIVVVSRQAERIRELTTERGLGAAINETVGTDPLTLVPGVLPEGFEAHAPEAGGALLVLSDAELFGYARPEPRRPSEKHSAPIESFYADLTVGDYVVHVEHGIARYGGLVRRDFGGVEREYLQLEYAGGDKLYVPVDQADRVARYVGAGEGAPPVHRLGTADWESAKAKALKAVEEIADDLMVLYSKRATVQGHAFAGDTPWQKELEESFPYVETPDQLRALAAIKRDMESERPMDRLICGDVGYGKTEVALRAAFKAVMDGRQVAVLVPTTVLAEQHHKTFQERMKAFPITVEMLSRFRTESQQRKILASLSQGGVDIVIGTHRLLQDDVLFKDLGLLVIDEEQRFGVKAKERLKQMRTEVDVLTLTATPIPRTLNMALMGARDMSTIDTPPEERLPIRTYVMAYDEALIKQAILRELGRNGQVFFVHNRVEGIEQVAARIRRLAGDARVVVGHGQMRERELERVMLEFGEGRYDVLVCTTIIESGIDLPNVNTIIVNRADQFGLADLYQLRGRVGRSTRQSYAYLMFSRDKTLVDVARKRLQAIFESSELGAGFKIAMRDLEIRGAGDVLGAKQHGHIAAIGFDLYTKLLAQAIRDKRESLPAAQRAEAAPVEDAAPTIRPTLALDLPLTAHLPKDYVIDEELRLRLYRRLAELVAASDVEEFERELADRFGPVPAPARNLLYLVRLKALGLGAGVDAIVADAGRVTVRFRDRLPLLEWRASKPIGEAVTVWRNTFSLAIEDGWRVTLESALREIARDTTRVPIGTAAPAR